MTPSNYRNLLVWQKARELARDLYRETATFPRDETFGLVQQMRRAAISILSNIAEGQGRYSRRDCAHFLTIARGSAMELEAQIVMSHDLHYIQAAKAKALEMCVIEVTRMLNGMLEHFERHR
jgi:four helix bundle protein